MNALIDMTDKEYGRWTVLRRGSGRKWACRCECGTEREVDGGSLRSGSSSGCISCHASSGLRTTHGGANTRLYNIWRGMKARCLNPNEEAYDRYGGRGIRVCQEWLSDFAVFRVWAIANGYSPELTIDRENNDGHYEPGNCRWATYAQQNRNHRRNRPILYEGRYILIADLAAEAGLPGDVVKNRIRRYGWTIQRALSTPVTPRLKREPWIEAGMSKSSYYRKMAVERQNIDLIERAA